MLNWVRTRRGNRRGGNEEVMDSFEQPVRCPTTLGEGDDRAKRGALVQEVLNTFRAWGRRENQPKQSDVMRGAEALSILPFLVALAALKRVSLNLRRAAKGLRLTTLVDQNFLRLFSNS